MERATGISTNQVVRQAEETLGVKFGPFHAIAGAFSAFSLWKGLSLLLIPGVQDALLKEPVCRETKFEMSSYGMAWLSFAAVGISMLTLQDNNSYRKGLQSMIAMILPILIFVLQSTANDHLNEVTIYLPTLVMFGLFFACHGGLMYYTKRASRNFGYTNTSLHDIIETALIVPNLLMGLSMVASPWNILSSVYQRTPCTSMVVVDKLIGACMLGLVGVKQLTVGNSNLRFRHAIVRAMAAINFLSLAYFFITFSFRDVFVPETQTATFLFTLLQTGLRVFQLYKFPELMKSARGAFQEAKEQIGEFGDQVKSTINEGLRTGLAPGLVYGVERGPVNITIQEPKKAK